MMAHEGGGGLLCHHLSYWTTLMPARESMLAIPGRDGPFCSRAGLNPCPANSLWTIRVATRRAHTRVVGHHAPRDQHAGAERAASAANRRTTPPHEGCQRTFWPAVPAFELTRFEIPLLDQSQLIPGFVQGHLLFVGYSPLGNIII